MSDTGDQRFAYRPALDGLRALAVMAVVLFHSELSWARGGYLGVSTFFTLSGFLICTLLLAEHREGGSIDLGAFWGRRFRRLLPPALVGLTLALVFGATVADSTQQASIRGDVLAALGYVANWRFVLGGASYGDLFASPSPVLHFWSLAIEEQFYVLFPLLVTVVLRSGSRGARNLAATLGALAVASVAASVLLAGDGTSLDRAYFGTDARAAELLIGALLAIGWHTAGDVRRAAAARAGALVAPVGLVALVVCWVTVEQSTLALYRGGFALYALASATVVLGAIAPSGPVRALLALEPLRRIGTYSYGIYVYHWPVFLWLDERRLDLDGPSLLVPRVAVTVALAVASFHLIEQPLRARRLLPGRRALGAALVSALVVASGALVSAQPDRPAIDFDRSEDAFTQPTGTAPAPDDDRPTVAFFGDSMALMAGLGFADWFRTTGVFADQPGAGVVQLGCGWFGATTRLYRGEVTPSEPECGTTMERWEQSLTDAPVDICVVFSGIWNVDDRRLGPDDEWVQPGDELYDRVLLDAMDEAADLLEEKGCIALWVLIPYSVSGTVDGEQPREEYAENELDRYDHLNGLIEQVVADHAETSAVIDLPAWMDTLPGGQLDTDLRPDLVHLGWEDGTAAYVANEFLGKAIYDTYRSVVGDDVAPPLPDEAFKMDPPPADPFAD